MPVKAGRELVELVLSLYHVSSIEQIQVVSHGITSLHSLAVTYPRLDFKKQFHRGRDKPEVADSDSLPSL